MPVGKKTFKIQPKSVTPAISGECAPLSGVFSSDFPVLWAELGLPPVRLKNVSDSATAVSAEPPAPDGSGRVGGVAPARFSVLVEYESDDQSPPKVLHIRGWLVTPCVVKVLSNALADSRLTSLNLWRTGLTDATLPLVTRLVKQHNIRKLFLDANSFNSTLPICDLLKSKSNLEHLSLKCCELSNERVLEFAPALSGNKILVGLDLSCNHIGDEGAAGIAAGLRLNRTLMFLALANNEIGDTGASSLAEVLSRFVLSHDEIVLWRRLSTSHRLEAGMSQLDIDHSVRESSPRRSPSVVSIDKSVKGGKDKGTAKGKKAEPKKEDKAKKEDKTKKDAKKTKGKDSKAGKKNADVQPESPRPESSEALNPLVDPQGPVEKDKDRVYLPGSTSVVFLTLAFNRIKEKGVCALLEGVRLQKQRYSHLGPGLLKLTIHHNPVSPEYSELKELNSLMEREDPLLQSNSTSPGMEPEHD